MDAFGAPHPRRIPMIPITGISIFLEEQKAEAAKTHPELTKVQLLAYLNDQWRTLDDASRSHFMRKADYSRRIESRNRHRRSGASQKCKVTPYHVFVREQHEALKLTDPELTLSGRIQVIASAWRAMTSADKAAFINAAKRETRWMRQTGDDGESENDGETDDGSS
jgi:hypothetical protein